jgi:hypothetical protein
LSILKNLVFHGLANPGVIGFESHVKWNDIAKFD